MKTYCISCDTDFQVKDLPERYRPAFCVACGAELLLSYDFLREYKVKVNVKQDINLDDMVIERLSEGFIQVQPFNFHYEFQLLNGLEYDIAFDTDEILNECLEIVEIIKENEYFIKGGES